MYKLFEKALNKLDLINNIYFDRLYVYNFCTHLTSVYFLKVIPVSCERLIFCKTDFFKLL